MKKTLAPIILFVYNRPEYTKRTVEALKRNEHASESELFVFADGPKEDASEEQHNKIRQVREYISSIEGFKNVHIELSDKNKGLAESIINGVTKIVNLYGRVIVLEDDMITSPYFLQYVNQSLDLYELNENVVCINGFNLLKDAPIKDRTYFQYGADCGGWATWERGWRMFNTNTRDLQKQILSNRWLRKIFTYNGTYPYLEMLQDQIEGKIDSWAIRWYASAVISQKLCLYPTKSLIQNIGFGDGTHTHDSNAYEATITADKTITDFPKIVIEDSKVMRKEWEKLFRKLGYTSHLSLKTKFKRRLRKIKTCLKKYLDRSEK